MSTKSYDQIEQKKKGSGKARLVITGAALLVFVLVAYMVQTGRTASFDHAVDYAVYSLRGPMTNAFFSRFSGRTVDPSEDQVARGDPCCGDGSHWVWAL